MSVPSENMAKASMTACQVSLLTPEGRGAVATVSLCGPRAVAHASALFVAATGIPLEQFPTDRVVFGRWCEDGQVGEDVVVCCRGQDHVEVHCHGGRVAARTIINSLVARGCRAVPWRELATARAEDAIEAEARIALAAAPTERCAAILLDQLRGALRSALLTIRRGIDIGNIDDARRHLTELLSHSDVGLHLTRPWDVVLTGHANVGKSSLINALLGYQRCIVYEQPGTTRDVITAHTACDGWPVRLADTAGLRCADDAIEAEGVRLARRRLAAADAIVLVFDASEAWTDEDEVLYRQWPHAIVVHNKCDAAVPAEDNRPPGLATCALDGRGVEQLILHLARHLVPSPPAEGTAVSFTGRHITGLRAILAALDEGSPESANAILGELWARQ